jgi:pimeloyl-ACP methyl ester carboxylesterase
VTRTFVDLGNGGRIEVVVRGETPDVVFIPSAQRGAADFGRLADDLLAAGHGSVAINPRGVGESSPVVRPATLRGLADDVAAVVAATVAGPAHLVGHALGNVVARATAAYRPEVARSVTLLACGGHDLEQAPTPDHLLHHFARCHSTNLSDDERLESLGVLFFAKGNDASSWLTGWWPDSDVVEMFETSNPAEWWTAGTAEVLIVHPLEDPLCPPATVQTLRKAMTGRARVVELPHCSHAILPERPDAVASALIGYLSEQEART